MGSEVRWQNLKAAGLALSRSEGHLRKRCPAWSALGLARLAKLKGRKPSWQVRSDAAGVARLIADLRQDAAPSPVMANDDSVTPSTSESIILKVGATTIVVAPTVFLTITPPALAEARSEACRSAFKSRKTRQL